MSLTNVPPGQPRPDDSGGARADDHGGIGPPSSEAMRLKYEPDRYDATSVISVPVLVIVFFVLAFGTTTALFAYFTRKSVDPDAHPMAADRNAEPLNERMSRINRGKGEVSQPRLEPLRNRGKYARSITSPEVGDNPPYLHPEDSRAEPGRTPELFGQARGTPLDKVMQDADKKIFAVQKDASKLLTSDREPTAANAGRGAEHSVAVPPKPAAGPAAPKHDDVPPPKKKDEGKKDEAKKDEGKKEGPQPPKGPEGKK